MAEIAGMNLITPSSVSGTGVSLSGAKVVFTASTSISIDGIFDSTYNNYVVIIKNLANIDTDFVYRLRASGSDATGSNYIVQSLNAANTTVNAGRATTSRGEVMGCNDTYPNAAAFYLYGPALAQATVTRSLGQYGNSGARLHWRSGTHSLATSYDGITFYAGGGPTYNFTGALTIYGLSQ